MFLACILLGMALVALCVETTSAQTCTNGQVPVWSSTTKWTCASPAAQPLPVGSSVNMTVANAASTGTTVNRLAKLTGAPSTAVITATSDTENALGICTANCGTTGSATIAIIGQATCDFDGATTAGNYVTISSTTAGKCHDGGSTYPTSGATYGRVLSTNGAQGSYVMELMTPDIAFQNAGSGKSKPGTPTNSIQYNSSNQFAGTSFATLDSNGNILLSQNQSSKVGWGNGTQFAGLYGSGDGIVRVIQDSTSNPGTLYAAASDINDVGGVLRPFMNNGMTRKWTLTANKTFGGPGNNGGAGTSDGEILTFKLIQDSTGGRDITSWSSNWKFAGGVTPTLSRTPNAIDTFVFYLDGSSNAVEISRSIQDSPNTATASDLATTSTTLGSITGLSANIRNGSSYSFRLIVYAADSLAADGAKFDFDGGTATFSNARVHCTGFDTALVLSSQTSAIATDFALTTVTGDSMFECYGTLTASGSGTFIPRFAQNAHTTGTLTVYKGSHLLVTGMP